MYACTDNFVGNNAYFVWSLKYLFCEFVACHRCGAIDLLEVLFYLKLIILNYFLSVYMLP